MIANFDRDMKLIIKTRLTSAWKSGVIKIFFKNLLSSYLYENSSERVLINKALKFSISQFMYHHVFCFQANLVKGRL